MKIISISGKAQHGKDTTAEMLKTSLEKNDHSVLIFHNADLLKYLCRQYFGWDGAKDDTGRELLQRIGTDVVRKKDPGFWSEFTDRFLSLFKDEWEYVLIPDCRFPNELGFMFDGYGITKKTHLRVVRNNFASPLTVEQQQHASEVALDNAEADIWLYNDGTLDELAEKIDQVAWEVSK